MLPKNTYFGQEEINLHHYSYEAFPIFTYIIVQTAACSPDLSGSLQLYEKFIHTNQKQFILTKWQTRLSKFSVITRVLQFFPFPVSAYFEIKISCQSTVFTGKYNEHFWLHSRLNLIYNKQWFLFWIKLSFALISGVS